MKDFLLVLLGAVISCGTTYFLDWLKFKREEKIYFKRKKEDTYLSLIEIIYKLCGSQGAFINDINRQQIFDTMINLVTKLELYASKNVYRYFSKNIIKKLNAQCNYDISNEELTTFINLIRKDLNIKD